MQIAEALKICPVLNSLDHHFVSSWAVKILKSKRVGFGANVDTLLRKSDPAVKACTMVDKKTLGLREHQPEFELSFTESILT